ncbi:MAG: hypothetical protein WB713_09045 [Methyloceanibacter sp.]
MILISFVGFANLGGFNVVAVTVIGRGEPRRRSLGAHQRLIADHLGWATLAGHRGWVRRRGNGVVHPVLLGRCSGSRGG